MLSIRRYQNWDFAHARHWERFIQPGADLGACIDVVNTHAHKAVDLVY
jgi:hypothetical protein